MLKIKSLDLWDIGRHKRVSERFDGYTVGLTGPNGLGKTTLLQALELCYSGTIVTDPKEPLSNFIRQTMDAKPPKWGKAESEFEVDGRPGKIVRKITPRGTTRELHWDGKEKPYTKDKEVSAILEDIMGVDKYALNSTVFIRQGEMDAMFRGDTDRRDFYMKLLMLGDLPKIGAMLETHRSHLADSVQDLGAKKDTYEAAYREAADYFNTVDEAMANFPDVSTDLAAARRVVQLFVDQEEANEEVSSALRSLRDAHGDVSADKVKELTRQLSEARERKDKSDTKYRAHITAERHRQDCKETLQNLKDLRSRFDTLDVEKAKLADLEKDAGESPKEELEKVEGKLNDFLKLEELNQEVPAMKQSVAELKEKLTPIQSRVDDLRERHAAARDDWSEVNGLLKVAQQTLEMVRDTKHDISECPVCRSTTPPEKEKIEESVDTLNSRLKKLQEKGEALAADLRAANDERDAISDPLRNQESRLKEMLGDQMKFRMALATSDKESLQEKAKELTEKVEAWTKASVLRNAQLQVVRDLENSLRDSTRPGENAISAADQALVDAEKAAASAPWGDDDEESQQEAKTFITNTQPQVERWSKALSDLESAESRSEQAGKVLAKSIEELPVGFFYDETEDATKTVTHAQAQAAVRRLEETQTEHNEAQGRKDAANERLKDASRNLTELETQIAEQKIRLDYGKDLERLRDTFRPNGASMEYLNYKFGQIAELAADYLAESGADFMVAPSDSVQLSYDFLRTDREGESWLSQNRLSGGQKVRLAVATLRAIHEIVIPDLGLLVLDEPTTHLDEDAKVAMADMLRKIGEEETLQVFVCDHSPILVDSFSDVIDLQKYE